MKMITSNGESWKQHIMQAHNDLVSYLPELGSDLITALAGLNVNNFSHGDTTDEQQSLQQ